jgi:spoIIIJ-associated protein
MNQKRTSLEIIAPSVEEAVDKGLQDLGLTRDEVEVEVLDEGSRGLFGLGSRQARIRLTIKGASTKRVERKAVEEEQTYTPEKVVERGDVEAAAEPGEAVSEQEKLEQDYVLRVARETVSELLDKMRVNAEVTSYYGERDEPGSRKPVRVDIHGQDLSILIGRKAETLNALQYITHLIIGKELERSVPLVVDVEGYRVRREKQLKQLAQSMAEQAVATGRRQILEPMPSNERRLVHIALRDHPKVYTESIGEEPRRKVTIVPKE